MKRQKQTYSIDTSASLTSSLEEDSSGAGVLLEPRIDNLPAVSEYATTFTPTGDNTGLVRISQFTVRHKGALYTVKAATASLTRDKSYVAYWDYATPGSLIVLEGTVPVYKSGIFIIAILKAEGTPLSLTVKKSLFQNVIYSDLIETDAILARHIKAGEITAGHIKTGELVVGDNVQMGPNAVMAWSQIDKTGASPSDIGAKAAGWMPTAEEVGARPKDWMPSASDVGAIASTYIDANNIFTANVYATNLSVLNGKITTAQIEDLIVGGNVMMGPNAAISWGQVDKTGAVASDVGARSNTWMPTALEVGARPNTWTPTALEVGARASDWMPSASYVGAIPSTYIDANNVFTKNVYAENISTLNAKIKAAQIETINASQIVANSLSAISANIGNVTAGSISGIDITGSTFTSNLLADDDFSNISINGKTITWNGYMANSLVLKALSTGDLSINDIKLSKDGHVHVPSDVGLGSVPDVDATVASNINTDSTHRFITDTERSTWNSAASKDRVTYTSYLYDAGIQNFYTADAFAGVLNVNGSQIELKNHTGEQLSLITVPYATTAGSVSNGVYSNLTYSDPSWITSLGAIKIATDGTHRFVTDTQISNFHTNHSNRTNLDTINQNLGSSYNVAFNQITSNAAQGTAPFVVGSTTQVNNLNADYLDGRHAGNANNNIPVSNGGLNVNLNSDLWDGYQFNDYLDQAVKTTSSVSFNYIFDGGDIQVAGDALFEKRILLLNKAANGWLTFATRNISGTEAVYDLSNVGSINAISGHFTGWNMPASSGAGAELGYTGGRAYFIGYDRSNSIYTPVNLVGSSITIDGQGSTLNFSNYSSATFSGNLTVNGTGNNYFAGNVGIGYVNPTSKLSLNGNMYLSGGIYSDGAVNNYFAGKVGIGVANPNEKLTLPFNQFIGWTYSQADNGIFTKIGTSSAVLQFKQSWTGGPNKIYSFIGTPGGIESELLNVFNDGKVTIGNITPSEIFNVNGNAKYWGDIYSDNYTGVDPYPGYYIGRSGSVFSKITANELHVKAFIADLEMALAGSQMITKSVAKIYSDFTVGGNLVVEEIPGFTGHVFEDGDFIRLRNQSRTNGGLDVVDIYGTITFLSRDDATKTQTYSFSKQAGSGTTAIKGSLALDYGKAGNGIYEIVAQGPLGKTPYSQIATFATNPWTDLKIRSRIGDLTGVPSTTYGALKTFGIYTQDFFGEGNTNIVGTLTAGDANGWGNTFYAGRIRKNVLIDSEGLSYFGALNSCTIEADALTQNPMGGTGCIKITYTAPNGGARKTINTDYHFQANYGFVVSFWAKSDAAKTFGLDTNDRGIGDINVTTSWKRFVIPCSPHWGLDSYNAYNFIDFNLYDTTGTLYLWGLQVEIGAQASPYQKTDTTAYSGYDSGYGMWSIAGGFGGTIQNPSVALDDVGIFVRSTGSSKAVTGNGTFIGNWFNTTGFNGTILNEYGLYGFQNNVQVMKVDDTGALLASWIVGSQYLNKGNIYIGNNLQTIYGENRMLIGNYNDGTLPSVWIINTEGDYIRMWHDSSNGTWGLLGSQNSMETFRLGNENRIAGIDFNSGSMYSQNYNATNNTGFYIGSDGRTVFNNVTVRGDIHAINGTFTGNILSDATITGGTLSGNTIDGGSLNIRGPLSGTFTNEVEIRDGLLRAFLFNTGNQTKVMEMGWNYLSFGPYMEQTPNWGAKITIAEGTDTAVLLQSYDVANAPNYFTTIRASKGEIDLYSNTKVTGTLEATSTIKQNGVAVSLSSHNHTGVYMRWVGVVSQLEDIEYPQHMDCCILSMNPGIYLYDTYEGGWIRISN